VPALLTLPSAASAARAFHGLATTARRQLSALASVSGACLVAAYLLSPRAHRHPYLLYTAALALGSRLAGSERVAACVYAKQPARPQPAPKKPLAPRRNLEMSYEVVGDSHSEGTSEDQEEEILNGEEVRGQVERFLKKQAAATGIAGLGFMMAVVGIWGDGVAY
jgi:autophagy-related protein 33